MFRLRVGEGNSSVVEREETLEGNDKEESEVLQGEEKNAEPVSAVGSLGGY
jgi:hypothetical protein